MTPDTTVRDPKGLRMLRVRDPPPTFSVVVTCYKRERYVAAAVRSASLAQEFARKRGVSSEVVLVADLPSLEGVPLELVDGAVVNERLPRVGDMILRGAEVARGKWLVFLDDDDVFLPWKLTALDAVIKKHPSAVYIHNGWQMFDGDTYALGKASPRYQGATVEPSRGPFLHHARIDVNASSIAVLRAVLTLPEGRRALGNVTAATDVSLLWAALNYSAEAKPPKALRAAGERVRLGEVLTLRQSHGENTDQQSPTLRGSIAAQLRWMERASTTPEARAYARGRLDSLYPGAPSALGVAIKNLDALLAVRWLAARLGRERVW